MYLVAAEPYQTRTVNTSRRIFSTFPFPFLWGTATSAHQVEGQNTFNDWWAWEQAGRLKEPSGLACDHYARFREDFKILSQLGQNAHRISLEWSRLEPRENEWNEEAFEHYQEVLEELASRKIEPVVTLHHFTNPQWLASKGGWANPAVVSYFIRYVKQVMQRLGRHVRIWITINEPLVYLYHSFFAGLWPPGNQSFDISLKVFRNQVRAHSEAYRVIHRHYKAHLKCPVWVSLAMHISQFSPCRPQSLLDRWAVFIRNRFTHEVFLDACRSGLLFFPGMFCEFMPARHCLDFIGVNYYTRDFIRFKGLLSADLIGEVCHHEHHQDEIGERNMMDWEIYPEGFYHVLKKLGKYRLPILVTENGIATQDDAQRAHFIENHLAALARARREGSPVVGYLYWSLLDNFEWAHGFEPRFGIVEVDYQNQQRKIRESAQVLSRLCRYIGSNLS